MIDDKLVQPLKQSFPKLLTEVGMSIDDKLIQSLKQKFSKLLTEVGILMDDKLEQRLKQLVLKVLILPESLNIMFLIFVFPEVIELL